MAYLERLEPLFPVDPEQLLWDELQHVAVADFKGSWARQDIWRGFEAFRAAFDEADLAALVYVGGSFVTHKRDPSDIDFTIGVVWPGKEYDSRQIAILKRLSDSRDIWKRRYRCDFEIIIQHGRNSLTELLDPLVNFSCINSAGPPSRPVMLKLDR